MSEKRPIDFRLVGGLACLTVLHPILAVIVNVLGAPAIAPVHAWLWLAVGIVWILLAWLTRAARPLATLVLTGLSGGILTLILVGVIQLVASDSAGVLSSPLGMLGLVAMSTLGGTVCGLIAWGLQSASGKPQA